jgi:hypothetical protein
MRDVKSKIHVIRHGSRTSSSIGRKEDSQLSLVRKGLTPVGFFQFYQIGIEFKSDPLFKQCQNENKINIITSDKSRVIDSARGLVKGIFDKNLLNQKYKEMSFSDNLLENSKFDHIEKYDKIINKFTQFTCNHEIIPEGVNLKVHNKVFDKTISEDLYMKIKHNYSKFEEKYLNIYSKEITPYFKKLFLNDLPEGTGIYDFKLNKKINFEYFQELDKGLLTLSQIKRMIDFIRCNKFYEDIPIYKHEYKNFVFILKNFLVNHYHHSTTIEEEVNILRLKNFFHEMEKIIQNKDIETSYNIFINHNTAIRTFINYMLCKDHYHNLCHEDFINDDDFFTLCPKFAGIYTLEILSDNKILFYANEKNITHLLNRDFLERDIENKFYLNFEKLKNDLNKKIKNNQV